MEHNLLYVQLFSDGFFHFQQYPLFIGISGNEFHRLQGLANLQVVLVTQRASHRNSLLYGIHLEFQLQVTMSFIIYRVICQVNRFWVILVTQVQPHAFCNKWYYRSGYLCKGFQCPVQGLVGFILVTIVFTLPEAAATTTNIPVVQLVDVGHNGVNGLGQVVGLHGHGNILHHLLGDGKQPAVQRINGKVLRKTMSLSLDSVNIGIGNKEAVAIPQGNENSLENITNTIVAVFQIVGLYSGGMHQE